MDPSLARQGQGFGVDGRLGVRLHPLASLTPLGPWIEASGGVGSAGSLVRPVFEARLGKDLVHIKSPDWMISPFVGYTQIFQPSDTLAPKTRTCSGSASASISPRTVTPGCGRIVTATASSTTRTRA